MPPDPRYKVKDQAEQEDQGCETWESRWLEVDYIHSSYYLKNVVLISKDTIKTIKHINIPLTYIIL